MTRTIRRILGVVFWIALIVVAVRVSEPLRVSSSSEEITLANYLSGPSQEVTVEDPTHRLQIFDPVFFADSTGNWRQVAYVSEKSPGNTGNPLRLAWYASDLPASECQLFQYHDSGSLQNVVATLFPAQKRQQIEDRIALAMRQHGEELTRAFVPLVRQSLEKSIPIVEEQFRESVRRHRDEIDGLADKWNDEIVDKRLIPLARREIMPIVREHGQPVAEDIGRELWDRASLWRFGWRALYDKAPLPRRNLVQQEWERFAEQEAVPVFEAHMDEIVVAVERTLRDVSGNHRVRGEITDVADQIAQDRETRQLVRTILKETLVDNDKLRAAWTEIWSSRQARIALDLASDRLEPIVRKIGDDLFGSREEGINPDFARVLRRQILGKDRRWIVAMRTGASSDRIELGRKPMPYPIVYLAGRDGVPTE